MFGCLMLELLTGKQPWWWIPTAEALSHDRIAHPEVSPIAAAEIANRVEYVVPDSPKRAALIRLATTCLSLDSVARPLLWKVISELDGIQRLPGIAGSPLVIGGAGGESGTSELIPDQNLYDVADSAPSTVSTSGIGV